MSYSRVSESRPLDTRYDPVYTGPYTNIRTDPRVAAAASSAEAVAGQPRYKYFRRPVMPRMNAVPPYILLAPTEKQDPLKPVEIAAKPAVKNVEVQTMYRESEAQTLPYSPDYFVADGVDPEILLLKNLTYENGLPLGKKEIDVIIHARVKKEVESNLPPFTDEASLFLRKKLMEQQELREFRLRENELDAQREMRLELLARALHERDESNEFLASQRVEAMRQSRMEERERQLQKIRNKRIKVLRNLARQRNHADPLLTDGGKRDIITDYFDRASKVYAPVKREGSDFKKDMSVFDVGSRTAPLDNINNLVNLETNIPNDLLEGENIRAFSPVKVLSKTAPCGVPSGGGRAAEERMTSSFQRALRNTKRDVEEMHQILLRKKRLAIISRSERTTEFAPSSSAPLPGAISGATQSALSGGVPTTSSEKLLATQGGEGSITQGLQSPLSTLLMKKPKGRPVTPDLTVDERGTPLVGDGELHPACVLLQRLLRGRAVQNIMYEGRFRRRELIAELRMADEVMANEVVKDTIQVDLERREQRENQVRATTSDSIAGAVASTMFSVLANEKQRVDLLEEMQLMAYDYIEERRKVEAVEAGRRQKEEHTE